MVHQHLRLVESMTVAENVVLGWSDARQLRFSPRAVEKAVAEAAERFQMAVDPKARIWQLSLGERQRVEILKALCRGARILILDEPTTVLTPQEADQLFSSVRDMAAAGRTVIFISHKLPEVLAVADRVTVLRHGRSVTTVPTAGTDADDLAGLMVGREVSLRPTARVADEPGAVVLELAGVCARGDLGTEALKDITLEVRAGEILGIAGVSGNGQRELAEVITGLRPTTAGTISDRWDAAAGGRPARRHRPRGRLCARGPDGHRHLAEPVDRREPDPQVLPGKGDALGAGAVQPQGHRQRQG